MYDEKDIRQFYADIGAKGLEVSESFWNYSVDELLNICNGVGGQGSWLNGVLTLIFRIYQASAAIHDVDYHTADLSRLECDRRFRRNMIREWQHRYGKLRWFIALRERAKIELAYRTVRKLGGKYYRRQ